MNYFGKVFVEYWDGDNWNLSAISWWQYLIARILGKCASSTSSRKDYNCRHVPRKNVRFI